MQCNPRNKRGHQDLLPIIFYHFVIKINWYMYFIVYEIHVSMYLYFVLLYDYINLNLIVTDFGTWIRVENACWYFTLIWPTLAICAWMPCDCKACTATSAAEGDSKSTNPYPANIQKKNVYKCNMFGTQNQTSKYKGKESYLTKDSQDIDVLNAIIFSNN